MSLLINFTKIKHFYVDLQQMKEALPADVEVLSSNEGEGGFSCRTCGKSFRKVRLQFDDSFILRLNIDK